MKMGGIKHILLVSKDDPLGSEINSFLSACEGFNFKLDIVYPLEKALVSIKNSDYVLGIIDLPKDEKCIEAVEKLCDSASDLPLIVLTHSGFRNAGLVKKKGAQHVISKSMMDGELLAQNIISTIDRKRIEKELKYKDNILQAVNYAAQVFLAQSDWETRIVEVLARLGQASQSDCVYVFQNMIDETGFEANLHSEWSSEGVPSKSEFKSLFGSENEDKGYERWMKLLSQGRIINGDIDSLLKNEQPLLMKLGVKSFIAVPIFIDHTWWGFIRFDQYRKQKTWSIDEIDVLKTAANIFGAAISRKATEEKLTYLATHDFLTGIPNRMLLKDRFSQAVARAERSGEKIAIVSIDLDKFKVVNDTYGHPVGDKVLVEIAQRFFKTLRGSDTCARIGGDEFGVVAEEIHCRADAMRVMEKITTSLRKPIKLNENEIYITASMGAAFYPDHAKSLEGLLNAADKALYQVKGKKSSFKIFNDGQYSLLKE